MRVFEILKNRKKLKNPFFPEILALSRLTRGGVAVVSLSLFYDGDEQKLNTGAASLPSRAPITKFIGSRRFKVQDARY